MVQTRPKRRMSAALGLRVKVTAAAGVVVLIVGVVTLASLRGSAPPSPPGARQATVATPLPATPLPATPRPTSARVTSIAGLLSVLADASVTDIVVANGTYHVSPASSQASDSLWIGARYSGRTRPVTVRAETQGGVTFDGGGATGFGCISFEGGAHHQTWDGFRCANGSPTQTGVIMFGGYAGQAAPHHIALRDWSLLGSLTTPSTGATDHGVYFSEAVDGPHDIALETLSVDGSGGLDSAVHAYHSDASNKNAWNVTITGMSVSGTAQAVILWDSTLHDWTIRDSTISSASDYAVRYESPGATGISFINVTSFGSGSGTGFYSSLGSSPPGVTFTNTSWH
jgi:hypothetical protein